MRSSTCRQCVDAWKRPRSVSEPRMLLAAFESLSGGNISARADEVSNCGKAFTATPSPLTRASRQPWGFGSERRWRSHFDGPQRGPVAKPKVAAQRLPRVISTEALATPTGLRRETKWDERYVWDYLSPRDAVRNPFGVDDSILAGYPG